MQKGGAIKVERMEYRRMHAAAGPAMLAIRSEPPRDSSANPETAELQSQIKDLERRLRDQEVENGRELERIRKESFESGCRQSAQQGQQRLEGMASSVDHALTAFAEERDRYFADVEQEVVRLALAVAARILNRETLMDPLLLSGAVRVALGQLAENTEARLRVPASEKDLWEEMLQLCPNLPLRPLVVAENDLDTGACRLETSLGTVDLGIKAQLEEIERGFFDLLELRPRAGEQALAKARSLVGAAANPAASE